MVPTVQYETHTWLWRGHKINYTVRGQGQPLILLHGFGASVGHWRKNIPVLAEHYQVYALDWIGFGASDKPEVEYTLNLLEEQLIDFVKTFITEPVVLVGNSIGSLVALMASAHQPSGVPIKGTVLLNCAGGLTHRPEELPAFLRPMMEVFRLALNIPGVGAFLFNRVRSPRNVRNTLLQVYGNKDAVTDELVDLLCKPAEDPGAAQVFIKIIAGPAGDELPEELLPLVPNPILVLWGEDDPWTPIKRGRDFTKYHPNLEFVALPQTGHCPHDDQPELVHSYLLPWLNQLVQRN